ncbi:MAG TPA: type II toxin-antitoxin system VapB family antitoxin [Pelovirga sp.]|nr:type II toxin-antitoxin system VapB family antitoxin [Pelovirga sp.]
MRATLNIPDELIRKVQEITGKKSKTGAIVAVMEEFVQQKKIDELLSLRGKLVIDYDWEQAENDELRAAESREKYGEY